MTDVLISNILLFQENFDITVEESKVQVAASSEIEFDREKVRRCSMQSFSKFTGDLLAVAFDKSQLATSSITGRACNLHTKKGIEPKTKLCPIKLRAVQSKYNYLKSMNNLYDLKITYT